MKKQTLTKNQVEILKVNIRAAVQYHSSSADYIGKKLQQIDQFLKLAAELYILDDYSEVARIMKEVGDAGLDEFDLIKKTTA
jgi:hypothetical protein